MNLSAPFIHRPVMTTFVMLSIVVAGVIAFFKLPVSDLPTIERPHIQVSAGYLGANPETILNQITIPLEKELMHVKGIQEISSSSSTGFSSISLAFGLDKDMDEAIRDVQTALNRAEQYLPKDLDPRPTYHLQEDSQDPIMYIIMTSESSSVGDMRSYADAYIIPRLSRIEGISQVLSFGEQKTIRLRLNPELMAARQIGFNEVIETVSQQTAQMPLGTIQTSTKRLAIEWPGTIQEGKDLENVRIGNTSVRIKDIGEVTDKSDQDTIFHFVSKDKTSLALILAVQKVSDANTVAISEEVQTLLKTLDKELPSTLHLNLWFDKALWIEESLVDVQWSLFFAFILVVLVIYFSLGRLSESMITSAALPLSLVGTFAIMYLANFSLDLLSLLALTLSVGFVVDDAIVVLENIVRCQEKGQSPREASLLGSQQICFTILSMTLSLVAVFIPLLFMEGMNGRLFREFSITLSVAILVSGFVSLTLTPMLCSRFLSHQHSENKLQKKITAVNTWMANLYGKTLKYCFRYPKSILLMALSCMGLTYFLFTKLPVDLIPQEDRGYLLTFVNLPSGISPTQLNEEQHKLEDLIKTNPSIDNFLSLNFHGNLLFVIKNLPITERPPQGQIMSELQAVLDAIPGTQTFIQPYQLINLDMDFGNAGKYQMAVRGLEFADIEKATQLLTAELQTHPEFSFVQNSLSKDSSMLTLHVDEDVTDKLGFSKQQIQALLQNAYGKSSVGEIQKGAIQKKIYLELLPEYAQQKSSPDKLYVTTPIGNFVPLKAMVEWEEKLGTSVLKRLEQLPSEKINFSLAENIPPNVGLARVEEIAASVLPANVSGTLTGSAKAITSTIRDTLLLLCAAALVMYIVLGILYESFIHPLTILSSVPFACLGGVLTLFLFGQPISIFSAVGFLLLIGIVKKNGIMMVDYAVEAQKNGMNSEQAIFDACIVRFRPIMMTTVAAVMGAVPLALGFGDSGEMRKGLGLVIIGGLLFSQVLTLYVTPILFLTFDKLFTKRSRTKQEIHSDGSVVHV